MEAAAPAGAASTRPLEPHRILIQETPADACSSSLPSTSGAADLRTAACEAGGEEGVLLDLDSPWAAQAEAERILVEAAATDAAAALQISREVEREQEDEIRDNQQRQEDEAIYGHDLAVFENKRGLRYFQICIRYDLPDGIEVCSKLSSANVCAKDEGCSDGTEHGDGSDVFSYRCNFEYLPPLILTCLLPRSYPSKDPPYFTVTAKWVDAPQVSQLCEMLNTIWAELKGQDDRAISRTNPLESVIPLMMSYNNKKHHQAFLEDLHMCMICLNQSKGSNFVRLSCQHLFCVKCMETLCKMHVKEGSVFKLVCPDTKCNVSIPPFVLVLKKALDSMSDVVYCPRCGIGCLEDQSKDAQCPKCSFIFCSLCKEPCHPAKQCITPEEKIKRQQASGKMSEKEMARELLAVRKMFSDIQICPKCKMPIVKTEGCNKMSCGNCGQLLCFRCGRAIDGYDHFWNECELFELRQYDDVTPFERHMEEVQIGRRVKVQLTPIGSTIRCPKCRQRNFKENEEYIFCWACRIHYCSLCRIRVDDKYMKSGHYRSSECVGLGNF
ncbi:hypothetical protein HU200_063301 [Digitaria exilis]|uniref:RBR-type E3 ubiquitin transferase n=1 Tax=Digitaria exilis TaxID=1010633 RepID=A0A835DWK8_9POAL|nr:hypothetical protein HU200_063301 [Digitaria exilis]